MKQHKVKVIDVGDLSSFEKDAENLLDMGYEMKIFNTYYYSIDETISGVAYVGVFVKVEND